MEIENCAEEPPLPSQQMWDYLLKERTGFFSRKVRPISRFALTFFEKPSIILDYIYLFFTDRARLKRYRQLDWELTKEQMRCKNAAEVFTIVYSLVLYVIAMRIIGIL